MGHSRRRRCARACWSSCASRHSRAANVTTITAMDTSSNCEPPIVWMVSPRQALQRATPGPPGITLSGIPPTAVRVLRGGRRRIKGRSSTAGR